MPEKDNDYRWFLREHVRPLEVTKKDSDKVLANDGLDNKVMTVKADNMSTAVYFDNEFKPVKISTIIDDLCDPTRTEETVIYYGNAVTDDNPYGVQSVLHSTWEGIVLTSQKVWTYTFKEIDLDFVEDIHLDWHHMWDHFF